MADPLFGADQLIADLQQSLRDTLETSLQTTPKLLRRTLETGAWQDFHTPLREHVVHERFEDFVTADPFDGLGTTMDVIRGYKKADPELARLLDGQVKPPAKHGAVGRGRTRDYDTNSVDRPDSADHVIGRLKRDDPELAERVVNGDLTPNAAARMKGWRKPRIVVSTPERVADSLRKHMEPAARRRLAELLLEEGGV